jgi:hypothetical protein
MSSVVDCIECPDCGSEAYNEFYCESGEEYITCNHCGYSRKFYIINMDDQDKPQEEGFDWLPDYKIEEVHGCGAYKIRPIGAAAYECGAFTEPASEEEFKRLIEERRSELAHAEYSTFVDGVLVKTVLIQEELDEPDTFEDDGLVDPFATQEELDRDGIVE